MKISQKLWAVLLILAILLSIVGCGFDPIVSVDDSTSISDKSTAFVSPIIDEGPETDKQTETVDAGPETAGESSETVDQTKTADESSVSDKQEETTSQAADLQASERERRLRSIPHLSAHIREPHM